MTSSPGAEAIRHSGAHAGGRLPRGVVLERRLARDRRQRYYLYLPAGPIRHGELFVTVHGVSRNAREHAERFARLAERHGVVLVAPRYSRRRNRGYQRLAEGRGNRADTILLQIVDEVAALCGRQFPRLALFGYSAGGQFVHRFALLHPHRVGRYAIGAAGWYTLPDPDRPFPQGTGRPAGAGLEPDLAAFARIPALVLIGDRDILRDASLNTDPWLDRHQGRNRLERARQWVKRMHAVAGGENRHRLVLLRGVGHDFRQCMLFGCMGEQVVSHLLDRPAPIRLAN